VRICYEEYVDAEVQQRQPVVRTPACAPAVVYCMSSGTYTVDGYAVNIRHEATLPGAALRLPCDHTPQTGIQTTCLKDSHFWLCLRALTHN